MVAFIPVSTRLAYGVELLVAHIDVWLEHEEGHFFREVSGPGEGEPQPVDESLFEDIIDGFEDVLREHLSSTWQVIQDQTLTVAGHTSRSSALVRITGDLVLHRAIRRGLWEWHTRVGFRSAI